VQHEPEDDAVFLREPREREQEADDLVAAGSRPAVGRAQLVEEPHVRVGRERLEQRLLAREVVEDGALRDVGPLGDLLDGGRLVALLRKSTTAASRMRR
jgi:hypothetical protein